MEFEQVADNAVNLNTELKTKLIGLLKVFKDSFYGTQGEWNTDNVDPKLKPNSKLFNCKYQTVLLFQHIIERWPNAVCKAACRGPKEKWGPT